MWHASFIWETPLLKQLAPNTSVTQTHKNTSLRTNPSWSLMSDWLWVIDYAWLILSDWLCVIDYEWLKIRHPMGLRHPVWVLSIDSCIGYKCHDHKLLIISHKSLIFNHRQLRIDHDPYSLLYLECHLTLIFKLSHSGLFSTERGKRDRENLSIDWDSRLKTWHSSCNRLYLVSIQMWHASFMCEIPHRLKTLFRCVAVCCSVLQCVAVCCSVLQCGAVWCSAVQCVLASHLNRSWHRPRSFLEADFRLLCPPVVYRVPLSRTKPAF